MKTLTTVTLAFVFGRILATDPPKYSLDGTPLEECDVDIKQVCSATLRIGKDTWLLQGRYCSCDTCGNWTDPRPDDNMAFNWYHHLRGDWLVQYRFCEPVVPTYRRCAGPDKRKVAATIRAGASSWFPSLVDIDCRCQSSVYYMQGWMLVEEKGKESVWKYDFVCDRPRCKPMEPCVKRYLARSGTHTVGFQYACSCLAGQYCATEFDGHIKSYDIDDSDQEGPFIYGYCRHVSVFRPASIRGWA